MGERTELVRRALEVAREIFDCVDAYLILSTSPLLTRVLTVNLSLRDTRYPDQPDHFGPLAQGAPAEIVRCLKSSSAIA
jgi:hypothetical protein